MKTAVLLVLALLAASVAAAGTNWAIIIAGSNEYYNYRHQADICHAYQILHSNGFPDSNIVVMMYDDIANSPENPVKGNIINKPNGPNVYPGVVKDYIADDCNAKNFLAALSGNKAGVTGGSGKVVDSGPDDRVFVYYADHGAAGLVGMPSGPYLYATDLIKTLKQMNTDKKYKELLFYLEACESGSMFQDLPADINIYATTAANAQESSYACYYDSKRQTYLGDVYSVNWMEDSDKGFMKNETLDDQYNIVKEETNTSHVQRFGQTSMGSEEIGFYQAFEQMTRGKKIVNLAEQKYLRSVRESDSVQSRDVVLETLSRSYVEAHPSDKPQIEERLREEVGHREETDRIIRDVAKEVDAEHLMHVRYNHINGKCLKQMVESFEMECGRFSDYGLQYVRVLANMCESGINPEAVAAAARKHC